MKSLPELLAALTSTAQTLEVTADEAVKLAAADDTLHQAISLLPWQLRRTALQLRERAEKLTTRYDKLAENTTPTTPADDE